MGATFGVFAGLLGLVLWLASGQNETESSAPPPPTSSATPASPATSTSLAPTAGALPGTDARGFIDYPGARCDAGRPAALARTTQSVVVVCRSRPGDLYYRGVRVSDGAGIELANPTDGTRYQIPPDGLTIIPSDGQAITEPMVEYVTN
jgi:hypothetical protein